MGLFKDTSNLLFLTFSDNLAPPPDTSMPLFLAPSPPHASSETRAVFSPFSRFLSLAVFPQMVASPSFSPIRPELPDDPIPSCFRS